MIIPDLFLLPDRICGLGHVRRSSAIGEAWKEAGGNVSIKWGWGRWIEDGVIILIDGYHFPVDLYDLCRRPGNIVVAMDDRGEQPPCDILINYNSGADELPYDHSRSIILSGLDYFPVSGVLRDVVPSSNGEPFDCESVNRVLSHFDFIQRMAQARYIICAASVESYEALYLGKSIFVKCTAENQRVSYNGLIRSGLAQPFVSDSVCRALSPGPNPRGRQVIDGLGGRRIVEAILKGYRNAKIQ